MTEAKKKADELVAMFDESLNQIELGSNGIEEFLHEKAVKCAIIYTNGMIDEYDEQLMDLEVGCSSGAFISNRRSFYVDVKTALEKM